MKIIIRNCPCYNNERFLGGLLEDKDTFCTYYGKKCQDCTDCLLKRIVEKCKVVINDDVCLNCNKFERGLDCYECDYDGHREDICMNRSYVTLAKKLLDMLEIQECE